MEILEKSEDRKFDFNAFKVLNLVGSHKVPLSLDLKKVASNFISKKCKCNSLNKPIARHIV